MPGRRHWNHNIAYFPFIENVAARLANPWATTVLPYSVAWDRPTA
jgi:hypothetical protein